MKTVKSVASPTVPSIDTEASVAKPIPCVAPSIDTEASVAKPIPCAASSVAPSIDTEAAVAKPIPCAASSVAPSIDTEASPPCVASPLDAAVAKRKKSQLFSQRCITFPCPICSTVLRTKGSSGKTANLYEHFRSDHPEHDPKTSCLSCCAFDDPTPEHRLECALQKSDDMKTLKLLASSAPVGVNVVRKANPSPIKTRIENTAEYYARELRDRGIDAPALANVLPPRLEYLRRDPVLPVVERYSIDSFLADFLPSYDYSSFMCPSESYEVNEPRFREYLSKQFREADPSTPAGKAVKQLFSFEPGLYYHLILCHLHLESFSEMYSETVSGPNPLFELTPFSCYCNTKKDLEGADEDLHLHFLARVPDFKEFERRVWSRLHSATGSRNKTFKRIDDFFHYCSVILYLSQQRFVGRSMKHFLIETFLTVQEELSLLSVFPFLGVQKVIHYSKIHFLFRYDVYRLRRDRYGSKLSDLIGQIGLYGLAMSGNTFDFRAKEEISMFACLGDMLLSAFGDAYFVWSKAAKSFCKTLFARTVVPPKERTTVLDLSMRRTDDGGFRFWLDGSELALKNVDVHKALSYLLVASKEENVCLRGVRSDVDAFKQLAPGLEIQRDRCFKAIHERHEFSVFFDYVAPNVEGRLNDAVEDVVVEEMVVEEDDLFDV